MLRPRDPAYFFFKPHHHGPEHARRPPYPRHRAIGIYTETSLFHHAIPSGGQGSGTAGDNINYGALSRQAESAETRAGIDLESLAKKLARALLIKPEDIDVSQPLHVFGVDSLVAMEIKNWIAKEFVAATFELVTKTSQFQVKGKVKGAEGVVEGSLSIWGRRLRSSMWEYGCLCPAVCGDSQ